jgi:Tfp pilus assembly protein PilN
MIRVTINLLPKEISDRRKGEKFILLGVAALMVVVAGLVSVYMYNDWRIGNAQADLAKLKNETAKMQASIQSLQVYEQKMADINSKKAIIEKAVVGKIEWSKELEELMIITPNEVSLSGLRGDSTGLTFSGIASNASDGTSKLGHKPVAKWLLRLSNMNGKPDVWLNSSDKDDSTQQLKFSNTVKFKTVQTQVASSSQAQPVANAGASQATPNQAGK